MVMGMKAECVLKFASHVFCVEFEYKCCGGTFLFPCTVVKLDWVQSESTPLSMKSLMYCAAFKGRSLENETNTF